MYFMEWEHFSALWNSTQCQTSSKSSSPFSAYLLNSNNANYYVLVSQNHHYCSQKTLEDAKVLLTSIEGWKQRSCPINRVSCNNFIVFFHSIAHRIWFMSTADLSTSYRQIYRVVLILSVISFTLFIQILSS